MLLEEFSKIGNESDDTSKMVHFEINPNPFAAYMRSFSLAQDETVRARLAHGPI